MAILKLSDKMRVIDISKPARIERSLCCFAPVGLRIRFRGTMIDPEEQGEVCLDCGEFCDTGEFERNDDGDLIDPETGERVEEGIDRSEEMEDAGGPDPDAARDAKLDL